MISNKTTSILKVRCPPYEETHHRQLSRELLHQGVHKDHTSARKDDM